MSRNNLLEALPDLIVLLHSDGTVHKSYGGRGVTELKPAGDSAGKPIDAVWPAPVASLARQLTAAAIAGRTMTESDFEHAGHRYDMRVSVQSSDAVTCVIRAVLDGKALESPEPQESSRAR